MEQKPPAPHCSRCNARWQKSGTTHCWSGDPETRPPAPADSTSIRQTPPGCLKPSWNTTSE